MNRPIRVLELRSVWGTGGGPEKTILLGTARTDAARFDISVCYLRDRRDPVFSVGERAASLPVNYMEVVESHSFDPSIFTRLRQIVRDRSIDIVHAHDYKTNVLTWLLSKSTSIIPLSTVHGWTGHSTRERLLYYPLDKRVLRMFPRVIAVSSDARQELVDRGMRPDAVTVVLNGIDHRKFRRDRTREQVVRQALGIDAHTFVIGAVGRAEPQKRFDLLLDVFAALRARHANITLIIAGDGSKLEPLRQHTSRLGLGESCRLLGNRTDVAELHHAFDVFVQSSDYEGTPNAVLEAMAFETPVIATSAGGTAEIVRHGIDGLVVPVGDAAALRKALEGVLMVREGAATRARSARVRVETTLSFDTRMETVEAIYEELFRSRVNGKRGELAAAGT